jgi:hypothetical protein
LLDKGWWPKKLEIFGKAATACCKLPDPVEEDMCVMMKPFALSLIDGQ